MNASPIVIATFAACSLSFVTRVAPLFIPERYLDAPALVKISKHLPASILLLLAAYTFQEYSLTTYPYALPEIGAAIAAATTHFYRRSLFMSLVVGIASHQALLHLFHSGTSL